MAKTSQFNYEKGDRSPDATYLSAVAQKGVDVLYVVTGERRPELAGSLSADETRLVERYRLMSNEGRATINSVSEALASFQR